MNRVLLTFALITFGGLSYANDDASLPSNTSNIESLSPVNFQGKWVMDKKTSPSATVAPANLVQEIKEDGDKIIIKSQYQQPRNGLYPIFWIGVMTEQIELPKPGYEMTSNIGPYEYKAKTTQDGNKLITDWTATLQPGSVEGQWVRTISDDGRKMTMDIKGKCSDGRIMEATLYFTKK